MDAWTTVDSDGDGNTWLVANYADDQSNVIISQSWTDGVVLTPDNWLISESMDFSNVTNPNLFWKVKAQDQDWADENYTVYVSTSSDISSLEATEISFNEVIGLSNGEYMNRVLDLSSFIGEGSVFVAFRHHNVSDMFNMNIDEIIVADVVGDNVDVSISSSAYNTITSPNSATQFTFDVTSFGAGQLSDFVFQYTIDGQTTSLSSSSSIELGESLPFSFDLTLGDYSVSVQVLNSTGELISETMDFNLSVVPPVPNFSLTDSYGTQHNLYETIEKGDVVLLDFMASWCTPCMTSTPEINSLWEDYGEGLSGFQTYAITTESTDNNSVMNNLGWGGFYPKFPFTDQGYNLYAHYNSLYGEDGIPLFIMICPDVNNPGFSEVTFSLVGWAGGGQSQNDIENALLACDPSLDIQLETSSESLMVYPNPSASDVFVQIDLIEAKEVAIEVVNILGELVHVYSETHTAGLSTIQLPSKNWSNGIYQINMQIDNKWISRPLEIIK
jgi:thiol-disulfide isomerase/thioredoxin